MSPESSPDGRGRKRDEPYLNPLHPLQGDIAPARCGPYGTCQWLLGHPLTSFFVRRTLSQPPAPPSGGSRTCPVRSLRDLSRAFGSPSYVFLRKTNLISTPCTPYQGDIAPARCGPCGTCQGLLGSPSSHISGFHFCGTPLLLTLRTGNSNQAELWSEFLIPGSEDCRY